MPFNLSLVSTVAGNTGGISGDKKRGIPKRILIGGAAFTSSDYASSTAFDTALTAKVNLATGNSQKLYPSPEIQGVSDKTEANKESTLGSFGPKITLIEGRPAYEMDIIAGVQQEKFLRKFNGQNVPVFIVEGDGTVWGKQSGTQFIGADCLVYYTPHKYGDGSNGQTGKLSISFVSVADLYDSAQFVASSVGMTVNGLNDVTISEYAAHVSNVHKIKLTIPTASPSTTLNVYDSYSTELADLTLWTAFTGATFTTALAITGVAANSANKGFDITFDSTAYTALSAGASIKINLATPDILNGPTKNVTRIEGVALITIK